MHQSVQVFFDDFLENAQKKFQEFQDYFSQHHNTLGEQTSGQISSSIEFAQPLPALNKRRNKAEPKKSVTFGNAEIRYFYRDQQYNSFLTQEELIRAQSSEISTESFLENAQKKFQEFQDYFSQHHITFGAQTSGQISSSIEFAKPLPALKRRRNKAEPKKSVTFGNAEIRYFYRDQQYNSFLTQEELIRAQSSEISTESSHPQSIATLPGSAHPQPIEISTESSHSQSIATLPESAHSQSIEISTESFHPQPIEISPEPTYPESLEISLGTDPFICLNRTLTNLSVLEDEMARVNTEIHKIKIKLDSIDSIFSQRDCEYDSESCNSLLDISECLRYFGVKKRFSNSHDFKTSVRNDDTGYVDYYDDLYQRYYCNMMTYKYLAFLCVIQYDKILELPRINASMKSAYLSDHYNKIVQIIRNNFESAIDFFIDYSQNIQNYNLQLSLKEIKSFIEIYKKISSKMDKEEELFQSFDKLNLNFNIQEKIESAIDFFTNKGPRDIELDSPELKFIEEEILKSINSSEKYLSDHQLAKCCSIYIKFKGHSYNTNTIKIKEFYDRLRSSMPRDGQVRALINYYEGRDNPPPHLSTATDLSTVTELKIKQDILKKEFIDGLKFISSSFNLRTIPDLRQLTMNPLIVDARQVEGNIKYLPGTEILL